MLYLCYANQMEALIEPLLVHIEACQKKDPLTPVDIIVPNSSVAHFVRFQVAQRHGVSANLSFHYLQRYLRSAIKEVNPNIEILQGESLQMLIFKHLNLPEVLQHLSLEPVRTYLDVSQSAEEREGRCIQLAGQLARLFEEYSYSRQELLAEWVKGSGTLKESAWARAEDWQRVIWRGLFDEDGAILLESERKESRKAQSALLYVEGDHVAQRRKRKKGVRSRWLFLPAAVRASARKLKLPKELYVFGLSYVAPAFAEIFTILSQRTTLNIYAINPCCEFWEDVDHRADVVREGWISRTVRVENFQNIEDPFALEELEDTPALRLWGRPGREYIRMLNQLTDCTFHSVFIDPIESRKAKTQLAEIQRDILYRSPARAPLEEDRPLDGSIRLIACPGVRREVEIIADDIWRLMNQTDQDDSPLRFHQIAVMVTDRKRQEYMTHIEVIFRERYQIPFNMIDRTLSAQSNVLEGLIRLLELPRGEYSYSDVLDVACHPSIGGGIEGVDIEQWKRWTEQLNIRFGSDLKALEGTYIDRDVYHWDQGLRRLLLGCLMEGEPSGDERIFTVDEMGWVPFEVTQDALRDAGQFIHLVRCLLIDANAARVARLGLGDWCKLFSRLIHRYLIPQTPQDEQAIRRCLETLDELSEADLEHDLISFEVAQTLYRARLKHLDTRRGQHQADGIVVSSMLPMRAIPFNTIYILGMGEYDFPAKSPQDPLDLRQARQLPGDVSPTQRDRYLFLETLLCARERLVLSYVAFDDRTGEPLEPSAVVRELHFITRGYLGPSGLRAEVHPLSPYHAGYDWTSHEEDVLDREGLESASVPLTEAERDSLGSPQGEWMDEESGSVKGGDQEDSVAKIDDIPLNRDLSRQDHSQLTASSPSKNDPLPNVDPQSKDDPLLNVDPLPTVDLLPKDDLLQQKSETGTLDTLPHTVDRTLLLSQNLPRASASVLHGVRSSKLRHHLNTHLGVSNTQRDELQQIVKNWHNHELLSFLKVKDPPNQSTDSQRVLRLRLSNIRDFLYSPLQGSARAILRIRSARVLDRDLPLKDPLYYQSTLRFNLLKRAFWDGAAQRDTVFPLYEKLFERAALKGETPVGIFADEQQRIDRRILTSWIQNFNQSDLVPLQHWVHASIGDGRENEHLQRLIPALKFTINHEGQKVAIELSGHLHPLQPDLRSTLHCVPVEGVGQHLFLTGFLEMVFLAASHQPLQPEFRVVLNPYNALNGTRLSKRYKTPTPPQAQAWLQSIVHEMVRGLHTYQLPIKAVLRWRDWVQRDLNAPFRVKREDYEYGPVPNPSRFPIPPAELIGAMVRSRFGPWFQSEIL